MQIRTYFSKRVLAALTASASLFLSACLQDSASGDGTYPGAVIEGRVAGGASLAKAASGRGLEGASVTVVRLRADGSLETVSRAAVETDAEGRFVVESAVEAAHGLVVVARKEGREFKAAVSGEVKRGGRAFCRPLDLETTVEAEVYGQVHADGKAGLVSFADIAAHVDGALAAEVWGKADAAGFIASQLETGAEARVALLMNGAGKFTRARIEEADAARLEAQASLEAALHAASRTGAGVTAEVSARAGSDRIQAEWTALAGAGIALGEWAKAQEAAFRAMLKAPVSAGGEGKIRALWLGRIALGNALSLEAALEEGVRAAGGDVSVVAEAGAALYAALQVAGTESDIDTAFAACRRSVAAGLESSLETGAGSAVDLPEPVLARAALSLALETAATAEAVAEAHGTFYAAAEAEIKSSLAGSVEPARLESVTRTAVLINARGAL